MAYSSGDFPNFPSVRRKNVIKSAINPFLRCPPSMEDKMDKAPIKGGILRNDSWKTSQHYSLAWYKREIKDTAQRSHMNERRDRTDGGR